jgi:di/tricarboxylate transporter
MWFALIAVGALFRGAGWEWYWPWEDKSVDKITLLSVDKITLLSTKDLPPVIGGPLLFLYFGLGLLIPAMVKKGYYKNKGLVRYTIQTVLILMMFGVLGKVLLRLLFNIKYILVTPWFNI